MIPLSLLLLATTIRPGAADVPAKQPQLAAAHGIVALTFGAGSSIFFSSSMDQGRTFGAPVRVSDAGALMLGRHRGPRIAILRDAIVVSAVLPQKPDGSDGGNLIAWRSTDRGRTWRRAGVVNDVPASAREGLHAMAASPNGSVFAVWLDIRTPGMKLYGSRSTDGGATWSKNVEVYASPDGEICSCCHPSVTIDADGRIWVLWRNAIDGNRDIYAAWSDDGIRFEGAAKQGTGTWKLNACPMDGGGVAVHRGQIVSAWRRHSEVYVAEPGKPERLLGPGKDPAIARTDRGVVVAWTRDGAVLATSSGSEKPRQIDANGGYASVVALPDGAASIAWETTGGVIETARIE